MIALFGRRGAVLGSSEALPSHLKEKGLISKNTEEHLRFGATFECLDPVLGPLGAYLETLWSPRAALGLSWSVLGRPRPS